MKKQFKYNILAVSVTAIFTLFFISGCTFKTEHTEVSTVQKGLKISFASHDVKNAVVDAAEENGWKVIDQSSENSIELKKMFTKTKVHVGQRHRHKIKKEYDVYTTVLLNSNSLSIIPVDSSVKNIEKYKQIDEFNKELSILEKAIYSNLISNTL